jgi:hypothetical protein
VVPATRGGERRHFLPAGDRGLTPGRVVIAGIDGGMTVGTLLTIFVVPTVYTWFARTRVPGEITEQASGDVVPAK